MLAIDRSIFIGATSCFRFEPLKSGMLGEVESNEKMTRCRLQGGNGEVETGEQRETATLEDASGQGEAATLEDASGQGEAAWVEEAGVEGKAE